MDEQEELAEQRVTSKVKKAIHPLRDVLKACEHSMSDIHLALASEVADLLEEFETIVQV